MRITKPKTLRDKLEEMPSYHALLSAVQDFANSRAATVAPEAYTLDRYPGEYLTYVRRAIEQLAADVEAAGGPEDGALF